MPTAETDIGAKSLNAGSAIMGHRYPRAPSSSPLAANGLEHWKGNIGVVPLQCSRPVSRVRWRAHCPRGKTCRWLHRPGRMGGGRDVGEYDDTVIAAWLTELGVAWLDELIRLAPTEEPATAEDLGVERVGIGEEYW